MLVECGSVTKGLECWLDGFRESSVEEIRWYRYDMAEFTATRVRGEYIRFTIPDRDLFDSKLKERDAWIMKDLREKNAAAPLDW